MIDRRLEMIREYEAVSVEKALDAQGEESDGMERKVENHIGYSVRRLSKEEMIEEDNIGSDQVTYSQCRSCKYPVYAQAVRCYCQSCSTTNSKDLR